MSSIDKTDRIGLTLHILHLILLVAAVVIVIRIVQIQIFFRPDEKIASALMPASIKYPIEPVRGNILARDGRLLAMSCPQYQIHMDCTVMKDRFAADKKKGAANEQKWLAKARQMCDGLAEIFPAKSAAEHYKAICDGRISGQKYLRLGPPVDRNTYNRIIALPLFNEGRFYSGLIAEQEEIRQYPYGKLARRTIGFIRDNRSQVSNTHIGLEGKFDYALHGTEGEQWLRESDAGKVRDYDKRYRKAVDGKDIRTTLDIDFQDLADKALRSQIEDDQEIEGGCLILMDVSTGAVRAMVNLLRDPVSGKLDELSNLAIGRLGEPGSVFKTVTLASALSDGYIKSLDETIPTNHGVVKCSRSRVTIPVDRHIGDWERDYKTREISYLDGFKISSNYVLATLALNCYASNPQKFMDNIYLYKLGEKFDFDIDGLRVPVLPNPKSKYFTLTDLGVVGYGYTTAETPLHILTFYNAIAAGGKMMKPYLVESIEKNGSVIQMRGPSILNGSIFSKAVADTLKRALRAVTEEGTAQVLKTAACSVAGKTGTSQIILDNGKYYDESGRKKNQGTFVGFFPAENPRYSVIAVVYSSLSHHSFYGGSYPARAIKQLIGGIVDIDPWWQESLSRSGSVPKMAASLPVPAEGNQIAVPDLKGMGLKDAIWLVENSGLKCFYSGMGHVVRQYPAAGTIVEKGTNLKMELK